MRLDQVAERDGWVCWLCGGEIDPLTSPGLPSAPSLDHVVPRAKGGRTERQNLRLAHRRCNTRRGSRLPELEWPKRFGVLEGAPLWQAINRLVRRRGSQELVAVLPSAEVAGDAEQWVQERAGLILGGTWVARTQPVAGRSGLHGVWLRCLER